MKRLAIVLAIAFVILPRAEASSANPASASPAPSVADGNPHVFVVDGKNRAEIPMSQAVASLPKPPQAGLFGVPTNVTMHMVYSLKGLTANTKTSSTPIFELSIVGVAWADPAHVTPVIIRLQANKEQRVVGSQDTTVGTSSGESTIDPFADNRVAIDVVSLGKGRFRVTPSQPLPQGEYGVALRDPDVKQITRKTSDTSGAGISQQQMFQSYVWDFSVGAGGQT